MRQGTPENQLWQTALTAELKLLAEDLFRGLGSRIGMLPVGRCTQCGKPALIVGQSVDDEICVNDCRGWNQTAAKHAMGEKT